MDLADHGQKQEEPVEEKGNSDDAFDEAIRQTPLPDFMDTEELQSMDAMREQLHTIAPPCTINESVVPTPELGIRKPDEAQGQAQLQRYYSLDSLREDAPSPTKPAIEEQAEQIDEDHKICDGKSMTMSDRSETDPNEVAFTTTMLENGKDLDGGITTIECKELFADVVAKVKAGVQEEMATVLLAVEALRAEMLERWDCDASLAGSRAGMREDSKVSRESSRADLENLNSTMEESTQKESRAESTPAENCIEVSSPAISSLPSVPTDDDRALDLAGNDLRTSLLTPQNRKDLVEGGYLPLVNSDSCCQEERIDVKQELAAVEKEMHEKTEELKKWEEHYEKCREVLCTELAILQQRQADLQLQLEEEHNPVSSVGVLLQPPGAGPQSLSWVDSSWFANANMLVIACNLAMMVAQPVCKSTLFWVCDQLFLTWYLAELLLKYAYYRRDLFFGSIHVVWWNWLDLCIVVGGILDQWILGLYESVSHSQAGIDLNEHLGFLRTMRMFRLLRAVRFVRIFLKSDTSWAEGKAFRHVLLSTIGINSIVMSMELDFDWAGWLWIEHMFLIVYAFEIMVRMKNSGSHFFQISVEGVWNYIDFVMVVGGVLDLWLMPLFRVVQSLMVGHTQHEPYIVKQAEIFLKVLRIVRVLRLVRLMREMTPLYQLFTDFWRSLRAMQWVLVLTVFVLYAGAIIFTDLIGKGYMYGQDPPPEGSSDYFGTFGLSMFSLFKLMNGEVHVVSSITKDFPGKLLFVSFIVVSNWSLLAIMTSTVSDHLIMTSRQQQREDAARKCDEESLEQSIRIQAVFKAIDLDGSGTISQDEWNQMMNDKTLRKELCSATNLEAKDLHEFFKFLKEDMIYEQDRKSEKYHGRLSGKMGCRINYHIFTRAISDERSRATKRSMHHLLVHLRHIESKLYAIEHHAKLSAGAVGFVPSPTKVFL